MLIIWNDDIKGMGDIKEVKVEAFPFVKDI